MNAGGSQKKKEKKNQNKHSLWALRIFDDIVKPVYATMVGENF